MPHKQVQSTALRNKTKRPASARQAGSQSVSKCNALGTSTVKHIHTHAHLQHTNRHYLQHYLLPTAEATTALIFVWAAPYTCHIAQTCNIKEKNFKWVHYGFTTYAQIDSK